MKGTRSGVAAKIEGWTKDLEAEEARLKGRLAELDEERAAIQGELEHIQQIRSVMTGEAVSGSKTGKRKRTGGGRGLKREEIRTLVTRELEQKGETSFADLQRCVEEEAKRSGKSHRGIGVQLRGVVLGDGFSVAGRQGTEKERAGPWRVQLAESLTS